MASSIDSSSSPTLTSKENVIPVESRIAELTESKTELLNRLKSLKQELQNWRTKMDTEVKVHRNDLAELKKSLNVEVDQLRSVSTDEFEELRSTLQQQQDDVAASLKSLELQDGQTIGNSRVVNLNASEHDGLF